MKLTQKDRWEEVSPRYPNFAEEKVIVVRRNVIWNANIILGLG
jgi:hypothetical protein